MSGMTIAMRQLAAPVPAGRSQRIRSAASFLYGAGLGGPLLATGVVLGLGASGWLLAGLLLALVGVALAGTVRRVLAAGTVPARAAGAVESTIRIAGPGLGIDATQRLAYPEAITDLLPIGPPDPLPIDVPMLFPVYAVGRATPVSGSRHHPLMRTSTQTSA